MLHNKYQKCRSTQNCELYRSQRNLGNKIKRKSINKYFIERCAGGPKSKDFWPTIKPFLTNKGCNSQKDTVLYNNNILVNDQNEVCEIFNNFFVNVAKDIGKSDVPADEKHPSVCAIKDNMNIHEELTFKPVTTNFVQKQINSISVKKATGVDNISSKLLRIAQPVVTQPLTTLINMSLEHSTFPDALKKAQVVPIHKKIVYWKRAIIDQSVSYLPSQSSLNVPSIVNLQSILIVFLILFWQHFAQGTAVSQLFLESLKTGKKP